MAQPDSIFERPVPPNPATSTPAQRREFMILWSRAYTRDLALEHLLTGPPDHRLQVEQFEAVMGFGFQCKAPPSEIIACANAEWDEAIRHAGRFLDHLRKQLWPMCRSQLAERVIIDKVGAIEAEWGFFTPEALLAPFLRHVWMAAQVRRSRQPVINRKSDEVLRG